MRFARFFTVSLFVFLSAGMFAAFAPPAAAQKPPELSLTIEPSVVEITAKPGKNVTQAFTIQNEGAIDLEVTAVLRDFQSDNQTGIPQILETSTFPYASLANSDLQLNQPFALASHGSQQLVLNLEIPEDAVTRDWYFVLLFQTKPATATVLAQSGANSTGDIAANVLVRVTPDNAEPLSWRIDFPNLPRFFDSLQKLTFVPEVTNTSNTVAIPDMKVIILDQNGDQVFEAKALPDRILAQSTRAIYAAQERKDDPRSSEPVPFVFDPLFAFGRYTVHMTIHNSAGGPVVVERDVIALPLSLAAISVFVLFMLAFIQVLRRRNKKQLYSEEL